MAKKKQRARKAAIKAASSGQLTNKILQQAKKAGVGRAALNRARTIQAQAPRSAAPTQKPAQPSTITRSKAKQVLQRTGGDVAKATKRLANKDLGLSAGAANLLIRKASKGGTPQAGAFGTSGLAQQLQKMAGTAGTPGRLFVGQRVGETAGVPGTGKLARGMQILPGGRNVGVMQRRAQVTPQATTEPTTTATTDQGPEVTNPYQDVIDTLLGEIAGLNETVQLNDQYMQDYINQIMQQSELQAQQMSEMFNQQLLDQEARYQETVQQQNLLAQQEQEAARAFMINQGRMVSPANLQIGGAYGTPQLAGTQGFKYQPQRTTTTPSQVTTAFTAPTLSAAATPQQQLQPTVLNV